MATSLQIAFRNMDRSPALEDNIREQVERLEKYFDKIIACNVVVEMPHHHKHQGNLFHVRIDLTVPDSEIVVGRNAKDNHAHEDPYVAVRDAFRATKRQVQDYVQKRRHKVKHHTDA